MENLKYVGKNLFIEKSSVASIAKKNITPFYLYSENQIKENYIKFSNTFRKTNPLICFAVKSNSNLSILRSLGKLGAGMDVVSGGELLKALKAGIKANKIVFSGVGKTEEELKIAINKKILLINCESESEAKIINKIAKKLNKKVSIGFRLNPNIDAKTHKKISTGKADNKFGISIKNFSVFFKEIEELENISGFDTDLVNELRKRANDEYDKKQKEIEDKSSLKNLSDLTDDHVALLKNNDILTINDVADLFKCKVIYLKKRPGERYASALTKISLNNRVFRRFGKINLKDYISSFIKGKNLWKLKAH